MSCDPSGRSGITEFGYSVTDVTLRRPPNVAVSASRALDDLHRLYEILNRLRALPGQGACLADCTGRMTWPTRGVYFFFEPGEHRRDAPDVPRVVRVGTHAVSVGSKSSLWGRLRSHRGSHRGEGNHRGSVFRLHVGAALLAAEGRRLPTWGLGSAASSGVRGAEAAHERHVSRHIGAMSILWIDIPDEPGPESARAVIEKNGISLISNRFDPVDTPSEHWLGHHSLRAEIRRSGLWNLNHASQFYDPSFLSLMEDCLGPTSPIGSSSCP